MRRRERSVYRTIGTIFLVLGLALLAAAGAARFFGTQKLMSYVKTEATIEDMDNDTTTVVYRAEGREYHTMLHEYDSSRRVGDNIAVYYDPADPTTVSTGLAPRLLGLVFSIIGGAFTVTGAVFLSIQAAAERTRRELLENGRRLRAQVVDVRVNYLVNLGARHPLRLTCRTMTGGDEDTFISGDIWAPADELMGRTVNVYVDRENPGRYYVDTSHLNGEGGQ